MDQSSRCAWFDRGRAESGTLLNVVYLVQALLIMSSRNLAQDRALVVYNDRTNAWLYLAKKRGGLSQPILSHRRAIGESARWHVKRLFPVAWIIQGGGHGGGPHANEDVFFSSQPSFFLLLRHGLFTLAKQDSAESGRVVRCCCLLFSGFFCVCRVSVRS